MDSERHDEQMHLLVDSMKLAWQDRDDYYVAGNMAVYFSETQAKKNDFKGPDVFVVRETQKKERKSWVVWEEDGKTPDVVIELISPTTEKKDRGEKMRIYARMLKVSHYYLFDPFSAELEGYELDSKTYAYRPIEPDQKGWLTCPPLGLRLGAVRSVYHGLELDWLRWIDGDGKALPHGGELAAAAQELAATAEEQKRAAEEQAAAEAKRADKAEAKLAELQARLAELEQIERDR